MESVNVQEYLKLNGEVLVDGEFQPEKDLEAVKSYFINHVNVNMRWFHNLEEKVKYLTESDYWDKTILDLYTFEEVKEVFKKSYSYKYRFPSFMSAFKFYNNYAMRSNDKKTYLERFEDRISMLALFFGDGDLERALDYAHLLMTQQYQPATPTFLNVGKTRRGEYISCFLLEMGDSLNDINAVESTARQLSKVGGGVSINLTKTRAQGETLKGIENATSGVVPIMKSLDQSFRHINQLGQREGAGAVYLNAFHADIYRFLETKKISADDDIRCKTLNIGVVIPDKMIELAREDKPMYTFYPHNFYQVVGEYLDQVDMSERYEEFINNPKIRKTKIDPRDLLERISITQIESGYPYIMYSTTVNGENHLSNIGPVVFSNLCTEVLQVSTVSEFGDYEDKSDKIGLDISCNLGSLNIANVMKSGKDFGKSIDLSIDALNRISLESDLRNAPAVRRANKIMRSIGLGAMNLHGYLANSGIPYDSKEAIEFVDFFFSIVRYHSLRRSMETAKETGKSFYGFEGSGYNNGEFFNDYVENKLPREFRFQKIKELFEDIHIPTESDWRELQKNVEKYGLYNSYTMCIAPTGSISYVQSATPSIMPIMERVQNRVYGDSSTNYPMPNLSPKTWFLYKEAYDMDMRKVVDLVATAQKHIDQGISFELFVNDTVTTRDLTKIHLYAHHKGIKTLYYTRQRDSGNEMCVSCAV